MGGLVIELIVAAALLALGFGVGSAREARHYHSIRRREAELEWLPVMSTPLDGDGEPPPRTALVGGSVVISVDYFKRFLAAIRMLIGGRVGAYESLVDRARREALLRMRAQARDLGATSVMNVRMETASISKGGRGRVGSVEVVAYGTAVIPQSVASVRSAG
ncbi:MAG: heavy metal-binding domain-containing protein [Alphaproteobacteria bacterium]